MLRRKAVVEEPAAPAAYGEGGVAPTTATPVTAAPVAAAPVAAAPVASTRAGGLSLAAVGLLTLLLGAWGGIVPFVAPLFNLSADHTAAWTWNLPHALLFLIPGAVAVVMGLVMMGRASAVSLGLSAGAPNLAGIITAVCGAWFVIGPLAWPVLEGHRVFFSAASPLRELTYWIAYSAGPGVLLAVLGGTAMGIAATRRRMATRMAVPATTAGGVPVAA